MYISACSWLYNLFDNDIADQVKDIMKDEVSTLKCMTLFNVHM